MCAVAIDAEHAAIYSASEVNIAIGVGMVELALMRASLPAGVRKYGQLGVWYAVLAAYILDRIGSSVWVKLDSIVWALL